jgi:hypothetical protein
MKMDSTKKEWLTIELVTAFLVSSVNHGYYKQLFAYAPNSVGAGKPNFAVNAGGSCIATYRYSGATWHALKCVDGSWRTACSASTARPGLRVVNVSDKPGDRLCQLVRCQRILTAAQDQ